MMLAAGEDLRLTVQTMDTHGKILAMLLLLHLTLIEALHPPPTPHGMPDGGNHSEMSPSAVRFFGPSASPAGHNSSRQHRHSPVAASAGAPAPEPAESMAHLQHLSGRRNKDIGQGAMAGIIFSVVFGVTLAVGGSYIYVTRRSNVRRANSFRPSV